jgi:lipopolysaccharide export system permease protein
MKLNSIINRYLFKEMLIPFCISVGFFTFVFLMTKILEITELIVNYNIGILTVLLMLFYSIPYFLVYIIPMSVMITVLLTFLRLSNDNEIIALKNGGIGILGLLPPVFFFCLIGCLFTLVVTLYGMPWGRSSIKELTLKVASSNLDVGLKERVFNDRFEGVMLYVNKIDLRNKKLIDVFIEDSRRKDIVSTVIAPSGKLFSEPETLVFRLRLYNGTINQVRLDKRSANSLDFKTYDIILGMKKSDLVKKAQKKGEKEMTISELNHFIKKRKRKNKIDEEYFEALIQFHTRFTLPISCITLGLLALPLGIQSRFDGRSTSIGLGLIFFFLYFVLLIAGMALGETGDYPPKIGMWVPNVMIGFIGLFFIGRAVQERPVSFILLSRGIQWVQSKFYKD